MLFNILNIFVSEVSILSPVILDFKLNVPLIISLFLSNNVVVFKNALFIAVLNICLGVGLTNVLLKNIPPIPNKVNNKITITIGNKIGFFFGSPSLLDG